MPVIRKYEFGLLDLATPASLDEFDLATMAKPEVPPAPPVFSQEDLEAAEARGLRAGQTQGEAAALSRMEMRLADTMEQISYALRDAKLAQQEAISTIEQEAARLTLACFKKLFPVFLADCATAESEALITQAFAQAIHEPKLIVRCPLEDEAGLTKHLSDAASNAGFEGKLCVIADRKLAPGDCRIEWGQGGMNRNASALISTIENAILQSIPGVLAEDPAIAGPSNHDAVQSPNEEFSA